MTDVLSKSDEAERINNLLRDKVASHLFIFCNYNPSPIIVKEKEGLFLKSIQDLYIFLIDSSIVSSLAYIAKNNNLRLDYKNIKKIISTSDVLRSVLDHNQAKESVGDENIIKYNKWISEIIGKPEVDDPVDYVKPYEEILNMAYKVVNIIEIFINSIGSKVDIEKLIEDFENIIYDFYKRPISNVVFKNQIKMVYIRKLSELNNSMYNKVDKKNIDKNICRLIKNKYTYENIRKKTYITSA